MVARVGDSIISAADIDAAADTLERELALTRIVHATAARLGVTQKGSDADFVQDILDAAVASGTLAAFENELATAMDKARLAATYRLIDDANIKQAHGASITQAWLDARALEALWAPHDSTFNRAFMTFAPDARVQIKEWLSQLYARTYTFDAPAEIANELTNRGDAATLAALVTATGSLHWTVADFSALARNPALAALAQRTLHALGLEDSLRFADTPILVSVTGHGLHFSAPKKIENPIIADLQHGRLLLDWSPEGLAFAAAPGVQTDPAALDAAATTIAARLQSAAGDLQKAWDNGGSFAAVLNASGLAGLLGERAADLLWNTPASPGTLSVKGTINNLLVADLLRGKTVAQMTAKLVAFGVPASARDTLVRSAENLSFLLQAQPVPRALSRCALQNKTIEFALTVGTPLSDEQQTVVAAMQNYFVAAGISQQAPEKLGSLDAETIAILQSLNPDENSKTFSLDAPTALGMFASLAAATAPAAVFVGDWASQQPALTQHRGKGGRLDPLRLLTSYLKVEGFTLSDPPRADAALFAAIAASMALPLDSAKLSEAEALAEKMPPPSDTELQAFMAAKFALLPTRPPRAIGLGAASREELQDLLRRMSARAAPGATRSIDRGDYGLIAMNEPVVALKMAIAEMARMPQPISADGRIDGAMNGVTLRLLQNVLFAKALANGGQPTDPLYAALTRVADAIDRGQVSLSNLSESFAGDSALASDANQVLGVLREMASSLRAGTQPSSSAEAAIDAQIAQYAPLNRQPRPLWAAKRLLAVQSATLATLSASDVEVLSNLRSNDTDPEVAAAAKDFSERYQRLAPRLPELKAALASGRLAIVEQQVTTHPPDASLASLGLLFLDTYISGAEISQTQKRIANRGAAGMAKRAALSAAHHLFRLPGFGDDFSYNTAPGWLLSALHLEMQQADKATTPAIDASTLRYLLAAHGDDLGRSTAETLLSGVPAELPTNAAARTLLERLATQMDNGALAPFETLDITFADTNPDVRTAKALLQTALRSLYDAKLSLPLPGREQAALGRAADRLLGKSRTRPEIMVRACIVAQGIATPQQVGALRDRTLSPALLGAIAKLLANAPPEITVGARAADLFSKMAASGQSLTVTDADVPDEPERLLRAIADSAVLDPNEVRAQFDFGRMVPIGADALVIRSPLHNAIGVRAAKDFLSASPALGQDAAWTEQTSEAFSEWQTRAHFDPKRAVETGLAEYALFYRHIMGVMISYDMTVGPLRRSATALRNYWRADNDADRHAALAQLSQAWQSVTDNLAMFTAFYSPVGFVQDIKHEVQEGRLDVAAGKLVATAPMIWGSYKMLRGAFSGAKNRWLYKGKPYEVVATRLVRFEALPRQARSLRPLRRVAGDAAATLGKVKDVLLDPARTITAPLRGARALVEKAFGEVKVKATTAGAFEYEFSEAQVEWLRDDILRGGYGEVQLDVAPLRKGARGPMCTLTVSSSDLRDLADNVDLFAGGTLPESMAKRLGLDGPDAARLAAALRPMAEKLRNVPRVSEPNSLPSFEELRHAPEVVTTFRIELDGKLENLSLRNSSLVKLIKQFYTSDDAGFALTLRIEKIKNVEAMRALVGSARYRGLSLRKLKAADRAAFVGDLTHRLPQAARSPGLRLKDLAGSTARGVTKIAAAIKTTFSPEQALSKANWSNVEIAQGARVLFRWEDSGAEFRVLQNKAGELKVRAGARDITDSDYGKALIEKIRYARKTFGTADPQAIEAANNFRAAYEKLNAAVEAFSRAPIETLTPAAIAEHTKNIAALEAESHSALGGLAGAAKDDLHGRLNIELLKVKLRAASLRVTLTESGMRGVGVRVVKESMRSLKGAFKEPQFYLIIVASSGDFLIDLGNTLNDDTLSKMQKVEQIALSVGKTAGEIGVGALLFKVGKLFAPDLVADLEPLFWAKTIADLPGVIGQVSDAFHHRMAPLEAMTYWQDIGIPEAGYLKLEEANPLYPHDNDVKGLTEDSKRSWYTSWRLKDFYFTTTGSMQARLRQLCGYDDDVDAPERKPQDLKLASVRHFHEPEWNSLKFLQQLKNIRESEKGGGLGFVPEAMTFDFASWKTTVDTQITGAIDALIDGDDAFYVVDPAKVKALFKGQDHYGELDHDQKTLLYNRDIQELDQLVKWNGILNSLHIPADEKKQALVRLLEGMAAQHLQNSIGAEWYPLLKKNPSLMASSVGRDVFRWGEACDTPPDPTIDDYYAFTDYFVDD